MSHLTRRTIVRRKAWVTYGYGAERGSGYCKENFDRQYLIEEWRLFGIRIWRKVLDWEEVPVWAWVQLATVGNTEWVSKFSYYIDEEKRNG